jgi:hypothetical protein
MDRASAVLSSMCRCHWQFHGTYFAYVHELSETNALTYYAKALFTCAKSFIVYVCEVLSAAPYSAKKFYSTSPESENKT